MKIKYYNIIFIVLLIILSAGVYYYIIENVSEKQIHKDQLYTCPMHPEIVRDKPGKCPICHMDLVPLQKEKKDKTEENKKIEIHLDHAKIQKIGLKTEKIEIKPLQKKISLVGYIDFPDSEIYFVNSRVNGWVESLFVKSEGIMVYKGQPLFSLYSPELVSAQEEYSQIYKQIQMLKNQSHLENTVLLELQKSLSSVREKLKLWNITESQIKELENTQKVKRNLIIYSPYSGFVIEKKIYEGQKIQEGMDLYKIVDLRNVWVIAQVPEKDISFVAEGSMVEVVVPQLNNRVYKSKISVLYPVVDSETRYLKIRINLINSKFELKAGMYVNVNIMGVNPVHGLVVPYSSVIKTGQRNIVFVHKGNGIIEPREVETGITDGDRWTQILKGLSEGEEVVVSGQFLLDSETRIQESLRKMTHSH